MGPSVGLGGSRRRCGCASVRGRGGHEVREKMESEDG